MAIAARSAPRPPVQATGRVVRDRHGLELLLERRIPAPLSVVEKLTTSPAQRKKWLSADDSDAWTEGASLVDIGEHTMVFFGQRVADYREAGQVGPRWEFALDCLVAAQSGGAAPKFEDYFPSQQPYFERLGLDGDPDNWQLR